MVDSSDQSTMKHESFQQILTDLLEETPRFQPENISYYSEPACLSHLIEEGFRIKISNSTLPPKSYRKAPSVNRKSPEIKMTYTLTLKQEAALKRLQEMLQNSSFLEGNFTLVDLKKAFRLGAKRLHPDTGGNASEFHEFLTQYKILLDFFESIK